VTKAFISRDYREFSICWEAECPHCGHENTAYVPERRFRDSTYCGLGAFECDECREWFPIEFAPNLVKEILMTKGGNGSERR